MTTTSTGSLVLQGKSQQYTWNVYVSDLAAVYWKFSAAGQAAATSDNFITLPNEPTRIVDISLVALPTVSTSSQILTNDVATGQMIQVGTVQSTLATRSFPHTLLQPGRKFQILQM
jgi:hypothetical protein